MPSRAQLRSQGQKRKSSRLDGGSRVKLESGWWVVLLLLAGCAQAQPRVLAAHGIDQRLSAWVRYYAEIYQLPSEFVEAIIDQESAWNPYAISSKGAAGLMQLMPNTAARFGVRNRFRVEQNIQGGVAYLAWLQRRFHADLRLVTAAYYAGETPIDRCGLAYKNPDVYTYVSRVAERYRARRAGNNRQRLGAGKQES
jgi:soluble lytic murein transglycosylase-like protein